MNLKSKRKFLLVLILTVLAGSVFSKVSQKIDLGAMSVEGKLITPSDLTIDSDEDTTNLDLYRRTNYKDHLNLNLQSIF